jgi:hypothetical protein
MYCSILPTVVTAQMPHGRENCMGKLRRWESWDDPWDVKLNRHLGDLKKRTAIYNKKGTVADLKMWHYGCHTAMMSGRHERHGRVGESKSSNAVFVVTAARVRPKHLVLRPWRLQRGRHRRAYTDVACFSPAPSTSSSSEEQPRTRNWNEEYLVSCGAGTALMTYILEIAGVKGSRPDFVGDILRNQVPLFIEK